MQSRFIQTTLGHFATAQQSLRKTHPDPYFWGAFILTGK